jgi:alkanesulfonate monooxygenase SsuD/methylene tetrahydromethanopterin reductase-like flavin-dependent oxidoreductase (luciferase family)
VADLGIHGTPATGWSPKEWPYRMRDLLDSLPDAFTTVWLSDHLQLDGEPFPEGWTQLAYLAALSPRFRVGNLVLSQSYRNPGLLAAMAATLQAATGGRLILGMGAGWLEEEYRAFHFDYTRGGVRVDQLAEAIQLIKALWRGEPATFRGEHYQVDGAVCLKPEPPIPILVGTNGAKALKVVARHADWWCWDGPWADNYITAHDRLRAACDEIGRPFDDVVRIAELAVSLPDDPRRFRGTQDHPFYPGQVFGIAGPTPSDVIREIEALVDHGVVHVALNVDNERELKRVVDEVVPHVRLEPRSARA